MRQPTPEAAQAGLLDKNGQPIPGAATASAKAMPAAMEMMQQMMQQGRMAA